MFRWLSKSGNDIVILDKKGAIGNIFGKKSIDVILTPSFYWFAEKKLPVKFTFQAKEYLPSIFEEFTDVQGLSYQVVSKGDNLFWLFAYDDKAILKALTDSGIDISKVSKIYFAQNVFSDTKSINLKNGFLLSNINGIISRVPDSFAKDSIKFSEIPKEELSFENGVVLKKYTNFIDENLAKKIMLPLLLLVMVEGVEAFSIWLRNKKLNTQRETIFKSYNLPQTSFQNRAILKTLQTKIKSQQKIRRFISILFNAPFNKEEFIEDLELTGHKASIAIKLKDIKNAKRYKNFFLNYMNFANISKMVVKNGTLVAEFEL